MSAGQKDEASISTLFEMEPKAAFISTRIFFFVLFSFPASALLLNRRSNPSHTIYALFGQALLPVFPSGKVNNRSLFKRPNMEQIQFAFEAEVLTISAVFVLSSQRTLRHGLIEDGRQLSQGDL